AHQRRRITFYPHDIGDESIMTANHAHTPTTEVIRETYIGEPPYTLYGYTEEEFDRWLATVEAAAEQRGAARGKIEGLREAATIIRDSKFANSVKPPSEKVQVKEADWLDALADRLEDDDD